MHQPVVDPAERDGELVAGLAAERARLQVAQVMRVRGLAATDQAGLLGDVAQVFAVAVATGCRDRERALVDARLDLQIGHRSSRLRGMTSRLRGHVIG